MWERTPAEAQAYSSALEARVTVLAAMVQRLRATLQRQVGCTTCIARPSSAPIGQRRRGTLGLSATVVQQNNPRFSGSAIYGSEQDDWEGLNNGDDDHYPDHTR